MGLVEGRKAEIENALRYEPETLAAFNRAENYRVTVNGHACTIGPINPNSLIDTPRSKDTGSVNELEKLKQGLLKRINVNIDHNHTACAKLDSRLTNPRLSLIFTVHHYLLIMY